MTDKHLLITVSNTSSLSGIHFTSSFFSNKKDMKATLLYVSPISSLDDSSMIDAWLSPEEKGKIKTSSYIEKILSESRRILCKSGFSIENLDTKITPKLQTKVKDIIREGHIGKYDAVVLGRRFVSRFEKLLSESVSDEILTQTFDFPLWICRNPEVGRKNVLLCLDGSEASLRAADHVGYMLGGEQEDHNITLFHVDRGQKIDIDKTFEAARKCLLDHNVPETRITTKIIKALRVTRAIHLELENHKYAVLAIGLLGRQNKGIKDWFISDRSINLLEKIDKEVLWGCP